MTRLKKLLTMSTHLFSQTLYLSKHFPVVILNNGWKDDSNAYRALSAEETIQSHKTKHVTMVTIYDKHTNQ